MSRSGLRGFFHSSFKRAWPKLVLNQTLCSAWVSEQTRPLLSALMAGVVCLVGFAHAQVQPGFPAFSPQDCQFGICVNLANNNIILTAPIRHKNGAFPFQADFVGNYYEINSPISTYSQWAPSLNVSGGQPQAQVNSFINSNFKVTYTGLTYNVPCQIGSGTTVEFYGWVLIDAGGTVRQLPDSDYSDFDNEGQSCLIGSGFTATTTDGSGITVTVAANGTTASSVIGKDGSQIIGTPITEVKDVHGNNASLSGSAFNDTFNLSALSFSSGTQTQGPFTWTDVEGASQKVSLGTSSETLRTNFGCSNIVEFPTTTTTQPTSITFADNTTESWTYNPTYGYPSDTDGRLSKITLPTGGTVLFTYGTGQNTIECTHFTSDNVTKLLGNGDKTTYTLSYLGSTMTNTVVNPGNNTTVYTFLTATQQILSVVRSLDYTYYCYNTAFSGCSAGSSGSPAFPVTELVTFHRLSGQTAYSATDTKFDAYGDVTYTAQYDVGGASPVYTKTITYGTCTSNCATPSPIITGLSNIQNRPGKIVTTQNGSTVAQSNMAYNSTGSLVQTWVWTGSSFLSQTNVNTYNSNGTPSTIYDLNNNKTVYGYLSGSYSRCNGLYPFPTSITNSGTGLVQSFTYDCGGGVPFSSSDPSGYVNGYATTYAYNSGSTGDPYWRKLGIQDPLSNTATYSYPNASTPNAGTLTAPITSSTTNSVTSTVDGYGRTINVQREQSSTGSHYDTVSKGYLWQTGGTFQLSTSQPCSVGSGTLCTMSHFSYIDPLGRTSVSNPTSNETVTNTFTPTGTTYYVLSTLTPPPAGENAKKTQTQYDGLGRVQSICHIGSTTSTGSGTPCPSGSYNGAVDVYTYTQGSGYTEVSVARAGTQTRSNYYDAMGRLYRNVTPEGGTWNYYFDSYSGCPSGWPAFNGRLIASKDPDGNLICYQYDGLGRTTLVNANGATCRHFYYDNTTGYFGAVPSGITLANQYGRLSEAATDTCSANTLITDEWFSYDADGRQTNNWRNTFGGSTLYYHSIATYFPNGQINTLQIANPSAYTLAFGLDGEGRWNTLTDTTASQNIVTGVNRFPAYNPEVVNLTGTTPDNDAYTIDTNTGRVKQYVFSVGNTPTTLKGVLSWNANGTLGSLVTTDGFDSGGSLTCADSYDDWARLTTFDCGLNNWGQQFSYDIYDNLTKTVLPQRTGTTWTPGYSSTTNQCTGCTFDSDGNTTSDGGGSNYWGWNEFGKQAWYNTSSTAPTCLTAGKCITYDAFGNFYSISTSGAYTDVWNLQAGVAYVNPDGLINLRVPAPGGHGIVEINGTTSGYNYLHGDWLGNARLLSSVVNDTEYDDRAYTPYGEQFTSYGLSASVYQSFAGMTADFNNGVQYETPNREFSVVGRWLSPDPSGQGGQWNRYAYPTNPNSANDPTGLASCQEENDCFDYNLGEDSWVGSTGEESYDYAENYPGAADPAYTDSNGSYVGSYNGEESCAGSTGCTVWNASGQDGQGEWEPIGNPDYIGFGTLVGLLELPGRLLNEAINNPAPNCGCNALAVTGTYVTVGRWMSTEELAQMQATGQVVESNLGGVTSVTVPPNPAAWTPAPGSNSVFVTFDVPASSVYAQTSNGWAKIYGPDSIFAEYYDITDMPEALNIAVP